MNRNKLGERLRLTRIEKKMTQKEVAGDFITRNMLSQIENGIATPSIKTLEHLAKQLDKPVAYFMETLVNEDMTTCSDNFTQMTKAYKLYEEQNFLACKEIVDILIANINNNDKPYNFREIYALAWKCYLVLATKEFENNNYKNAEFLILSSFNFEEFTPYIDSLIKSNALLTLTKICIFNKDFSEARKYCHQFEELISNISYNESIFIKCELLINSNRFDEFRSLLLNDLVPEIKSSYKYKYYLGILHLHDLQYDEALNDFTFVLDNYDELSNQIKNNIYKNIADCYSGKNCFEEAYKYICLISTI